ncbi:trypsin-like serine peptidase [Bradyrhizobium sp. HKCCYLRH1073]|uniref:trypsin-like serine peptidase n=1 Tax=unclassified Bradyrhizobium TaxID=2631580 RepID=UPI002915E148|nr:MULTISPECIES: serine protease [unclassified Bradyrhizobium]
MRFVRAIANLMAVLLPIHISWAQQPLPEGVVEALNVAVSFTAEAESERVQWTRTEERLGAKYIRLHFVSIEDQSTNEYKVLLRNRNNRIVVELPRQTFAAESDFWTQSIDGDFVRIEVVAATKPTGLTFVLSDIAYQRNMGAPFSIVLPDEREPVRVYRDTPILSERIHSVAKLIFIEGGMSASCTGFLIDDDRMLTNEHCINRADTCKTAIAIFDYEVGENGSINTGQQFRCAQFIAADRTLDVSLIRLTGKPGLVYGHLTLNGRAIVLDEQAYMIQHPAGEPKQISRKGCSITTVATAGNGPETDFGHKCDTLGGSSGSPMLGADYTVIGLHHFGFDGTDVRWRAENRAVRMPQIISWVQSK